MYRRQHLAASAIELRTADGWRVFEKHREGVLPLGKTREVVLQNQHLPSRFPFTGLQLDDWNMYPWLGGA